jgi:hypothetical protein
MSYSFLPASPMHLPFLHTSLQDGWVRPADSPAVELASAMLMFRQMVLLAGSIL